MIEAISNFFSTVFGDNVILATILIAIIPLIELKGAIPFAISEQLWGKFALNAWQAFGYSLLGGIIIVPILALIFMPIYNALKDKKFFKPIVNFFTGSIKEKSAKVEEDSLNSTGGKKVFIKMLLAFVFVAFPVPLTGVWTGTCFAVLMGLNFWQTCISVMLGNVVCGLIMVTICLIFPSATMIILYIFLALVVLAILYKIISHILHKKKSAAQEHAAEEINN